MNLEAETRKGYNISAEMKQLWAVEMELLNKLLDVCNKHNLRIWADGGTLLGAVREHGYIPWDDDIDMAMLREDYDKLISVSQEEFTAPYHFQSGYTEDSYPMGHAQLRKDGTTAIQKGKEFFKYHQGVFIDIFVYDVVPDDIDELNSLETSIAEMRSNLVRYCRGRYLFYQPLYSLKLFLFKLPIAITGYGRYFEKFDNLLKGHKGNDVACMGFIWDLEHFRRNLSLYADTIYVPFEDIMMPIPSGYDTILRTQYGDYMKPVVAPSYHSGFVYLDTGKSYKEYLPIIYKRAKEEEYRYIIKKIKKLFCIN